jgi:hypothetical protein
MSAIAAPPMSLAGALERCREAFRRGKRPVFVFDIDDTILSTNRRQIRILREFAARRPEHADALRSVPPDVARYRVADTAREAGILDPAILAELQAFWEERFFANEYLLEDRPVPGAAEYCQWAFESGAMIVYLTGRDKTMRPGTEAALARNRFPIPGRQATLMLKPRLEDPDEPFKAAAAERVREFGEIIACFENEPSHANVFAGAFPSALSFLLETKHSGRPVELRFGVVRIPSFLESR